MKNSARGIVNPDRKIYYRTIVMNTLWCWQNKIKKKKDTWTDATNLKTQA